MRVRYVPTGIHDVFTHGGIESHSNLSLCEIYRRSQTTYLFASELNAGKDASAASRFVRRHKTHS